MEQKVARGVNLSPSEENLLAELHRQRYLKPREKMTVNPDGSIHIKKTMDVEPILEAMKAYGDFVDKYASRKMAQRMVGAIDPLTAQLWSKECGFRIGTKGFAQFAIKRIKNDIDYRRFRVGG